MIELAWPVVSLVIALSTLGVGAWAFHIWRHPTIAEQTLKGLAERLMDQEQRLGKLELAKSGLGGAEPRRPGDRRILR